MGYILIAASIFVLDFFVKKYMDEKRKQEEETILGGRIILRKYYNRGVALDFLSKWPRLVQIITGGLLVTLCGLWMVLLKKEGNVGLKLGIALMVGGGTGNLYDRIVKGHVVDYFSFRSSFPRIQRIVFNISDMFIFLGALTGMIFHAIKGTTR